jgi:hypothetical protein
MRNITWLADMNFTATSGYATTIAGGTWGSRWVPWPEARGLERRPVLTH